MNGTVGLYQVQVIATGDQDAEFADSYPELGTVVVETGVGAWVVFPDREGRHWFAYEQLHKTA